MSRDPDLLPSLRELGDRLGDAAGREIAAERVGRAPRSRRRWHPYLLGALVATLAGAGAVTATDVFTGSGDPVHGERQSGPQSGVLVDSAQADPGGGLPWAMRVFGDDRGRECMQLGRLRDGALGTVEAGQFRPFEGESTGACGDLHGDHVVSAVERRTLPAARTIIYGLTRAREPVLIRVDGERRKVTPGALGAYVAVFAGLPDLSDATVSVVVGDGRRSFPLGR